MIENTEISGRIKIGYNEKPFDIFVIHLGKRQFVGKKTPVAYRPGVDKIQKGCLVSLNSLVGEITSFRAGADGYDISFLPRSTEDMSHDVHNFKGPIELLFPFRRLHEGHEFAQPPKYWTARAQNPNSLDDDESFLRGMAARRVAPLLPHSARLFDPACSTGTFLETLASHIPKSRTIGQDLAPSMAKIAQTKIDEVYCGDALNPMCAPSSIDLLVCRHLNLDVVTSDVAEAMLNALVTRLKPGGIALMFGHTPMLVSSRHMRAANMEIIEQVEFTPSRHALFQFYQLRKLG